MNLKRNKREVWRIGAAGAEATPIGRRLVTAEDVRAAREAAQARPLPGRIDVAQAALDDAWVRQLGPDVVRLRTEHLDLLWEQFRAQGGTP